MAHWLISGMSRCGKSTVLKELIIPQHRRAGRWVGVLDPLNAPGWGADWVTDDPFRFVAAARKSTRCVWIVDEFRVFATDYKALKELEWLFFAAGNYGHLCYASAQRLMMIPPNVRDQCSHSITFQQTRRGLETLAEQFNQPAILQAESLPRFHAIVAEPFKEPRLIVTPAPGR